MTGFRDLSVEAFSEALGSGSATPGGGSAAALSGALAASLVAMVARNTAANPSFAERAEAMEQIAAEADTCRHSLLELVDDDAAAFERVLAAFRLPKETAELKDVRSREIQASYREAVEIPLLVCRRALDVLALAGQIAELGNPNAISDAGVAALLAASALDGAALNVGINLGSIKDESYRTESERAVQEARARMTTLRDQALVTVTAAIP
jgi:glutamate formiminotransferase/formiminotetrahydrofolate cyclodeaminase